MPDDLNTWLHIIYGYLHDISVAVYIGGAFAMEFILGPAQASIPPLRDFTLVKPTVFRNSNARILRTPLWQCSTRLSAVFSSL